MPLLFVLTPSQATVSAWVPRAALVKFSGPDATSYLLLKSFTPRLPYFDIIYSDSSLIGFHPCPYSAFLMERVGMPLPLEQSSWWNCVSPFSSYKYCYKKWAWLGANKALSTRTGLGQTWSVGSRVDTSGTIGGHSWLDPHSFLTLHLTFCLQYTECPPHTGKLSTGGFLYNPVSWRVPGPSDTWLSLRLKSFLVGSQGNQQI